MAQLILQGFETREIASAYAQKLPAFSRISGSTYDGDIMVTMDVAKIEAFLAAPTPKKKAKKKAKK